MDESTREAVLDSVRKYRNLMWLARPDMIFNTRMGITDCPLCKKFFRAFVEENCKMCPVRIKTGHPLCMYTPYGKVMQARSNILNDGVSIDSRTKRWREACKAEAEFLESLLEL